MTRILTLGLYYPPHHFGGYEVACADTMERLVARGHEVTVLTSDHRRDDRSEEAGPVQVRRQLKAYFRDADLYQPNPLIRWRIERHNQAALRRTLAEVQPEVISVWQMGALSLNLLTTLVEQSLPLVYVICDDWLCYGPELDVWTRLWRKRPRRARLLQPLLRVPTALPDLGASGSFCWISDFTRERAEAGSLWEFPDGGLVYMAIDGKRFDAKPAAAIDAWSGRLLYVGRYDPRKGIETVIRAVALLDEPASLEVQGTGDPGYRSHLESLAADLGVAERVSFVDDAPRDGLAERYRAADVCVFPSEWEEPFGMVPLESMACGTPVVATGVGGSGEFLADGANCLLFTAGDAVSLAGAVGRLRHDPALRRQLVAGGFPTAAYFDVELLTDVLEAWHVGAATGFPNGRPAGRRFDVAELVDR